MPEKKCNPGYSQAVKICILMKEENDTGCATLLHYGSMVANRPGNKHTVFYTLFKLTDRSPEACKKGLQVES